MKQSNDEVWKKAVERLNEAYSVGGRDALSKMTALEAYVLYANKTIDLEKITAQPSPDDGSQKEKLQLEVKDISGWLKENTADFKEINGNDCDPQTVHRMLEEVEAVTKARFYQDPEPFASPIEMFRMPAGKPGGEDFATLS